jgi:DNA repair exonuclease SbcCD ATPase subunit
MNGNPLLSQVQSFSAQLDRAKARKSILAEQIQTKEKDLEETIEGKENTTKARKVIQLVGEKLQEEVAQYLSNLVTMALKAVSSDFPEFKARMISKRNQIECELFFVEKGNEEDPLSSSAGGCVDVASFALRVAMWSLNKNRPTLILDEPFRNVSPDLQSQVSDMIKLVSEELGIQIIMVSHADDINMAASKTFSCSKEHGISLVKEE